MGGYQAVPGPESNPRVDGLVICCAPRLEKLRWAPACGILIEKKYHMDMNLVLEGSWLDISTFTNAPDQVITVCKYR